jgi:hypothetical protein
MRGSKVLGAPSLLHCILAVALMLHAPSLDGAWASSIGATISNEITMMGGKHEVCKFFDITIAECDSFPAQMCDVYLDRTGERQGRGIHIRRSAIYGLVSKGIRPLQMCRAVNQFGDYYFGWKFIPGIIGIGSSFEPAHRE